MAGPSIIATIGGNINPLSKSFDEAKKLAQLTGADMRRSMAADPAAMNQMWQGMLGRKDIAGSFMYPGALGEWRTKIEAIKNGSHEATGKTVGEKIKSGISSGLSGVAGSLAAIASVGVIEQGMQGAIDYAGHVQDLSLRMGISTDAVQEWDHALKLNGSSIDSAVMSFQKLGINMRKALGGDSDMIDNFKQIGLSVDDLRNKKPEDVMMQIAQAFEAGKGDPDGMMGGFVGVAGKGAGDMVAAFRDGITSIVQNYRDAQMGMREDTIGSLDAIGDHQTTLAAQMRDNVWGPMAVGLSKLFDWSKEIVRGITADFFGPFLGVISGLMQFDPSHPLDSLANAGNKFWTGGSNMREAWAKEDAAKLKAAEDAKSAKLNSAANEEKKNATALTKARQDELEKLKKQGDDEERRAKLALMTDAQKLAALKEQIELLKQKAALEKDPVKQAEMGLEMKKLEREAAQDTAKLSKQAEDDAERLANAKKKGSLAGMTDADKMDAIKNEAADLEEKAASEADPHKRSELLLEAQNKKNEFEDLGRKKGPANSVNSLQQMGIFLGSYAAAPEVAAADAQKKSAERLSEMAPNLASIKAMMEAQLGRSIEPVKY